MDVMNKWLVLTIILLGVALVSTMTRVKQVTEQWEIAMANTKAYSVELSDLREKNTAYMFTIDQLGYLQDSIVRELDETRKELKIKDSKLKSMQQVSSVFTIVDTIVVKDTIFKEPSFVLDTLIGDDWYKVKVGLKYPSIVAIQPEFKSKKNIIVSTKKETVNPPKKFFLARWFQKKQTVLKVDIVEKNPYVKDETSKYIEVLK